MNSFNVGDIIVCVDNRDKYWLTLGKEYELIEIHIDGDGDIFLRIIDDTGELGGYYPCQFIHKVLS